jgi:predicted nucleic acid-binding protein
VIYAEVSVHYREIEALEAALSPRHFIRQPIPWPAAFLAGKLFLEYRRRGGARRSPLPDFIIGAHAAVAGMPLITRDAGRYRSYLPSLALVAPT